MRRAWGPPGRRCSAGPRRRAGRVGAAPGLTVLPGDSVRADRASRSPGSAFSRSLQPWRGEGGSVKIGGFQHRESRLPGRRRWATIRLFLTALRLSGPFACLLQARSAFLFCSSLSWEMGAENAALGHEKGWGGATERNAHTLCQGDGRERDGEDGETWTQSTRGTTERWGWATGC